MDQEVSMEETAKKKNTKTYALAAAVAVLLIVGAAYYLLAGSSSLVAAPGDNVSVYYTGTFTNGTVFDSNIGKQPFSFTIGANQVIPGFEQAVIGMGINQTKNVTIPPAEGYGEVNPQLIEQVPINAIGGQVSTSIHVGSIITRVYNGQNVEGVVTSMNDTTATVDFNPPLAGQTLLFSIKVVAIKKG